MNLEDWPDCPVEGCKNKICLALDSDRCYPHTLGLPPDFATEWIGREVKLELLEGE